LWSEKLPFAEYSVVKDQLGAKPPSPRPGRSWGPDAPFTPSLENRSAFGPLFATFQLRRNCLRRRCDRRAAYLAAHSRSLPTSAIEETQQPHPFSPKLFQRSPSPLRCSPKPGLPTVARSTLSARLRATALRRGSLLGLPSRSPARGGGWWRIPGSNR
jgi:hypothetical protein